MFDSNTEIDPFGLDCSKAGKKQVHHIIPNAVYKLFRKDLKKVKGFVQAKAHKKAKTRTNLIDLETPFHGNHPKYNDFVKNELRNLKKTEGKLTPENVTKLQNDLRDLIGEAQNSGSTLNEFFKKLL
ncbi:MAG: AHH domain-containing protein [Cellulophaga fucicola]